MKLVSVLVLATTLATGYGVLAEQNGCANLISSSITQFFDSLEYSSLPQINIGTAASLTNIKVKGLNKVYISQLTTNEEICGIQKLTLAADELQIDAHYEANSLTIPNLVTGLTGSGELKIIANTIAVELNIDLNLVNCFEIKQVRNLIPSIVTGKVTLSGNPEKEGEVNGNGIEWVGNELIQLLTANQPQLLAFIRPHITNSLKCSC